MPTSSKDDSESTISRYAFTSALLRMEDVVDNSTFRKHARRMISRCSASSLGSLLPFSHSLGDAKSCSSSAVVLLIGKGIIPQGTSASMQSSCTFSLYGTLLV